MSTQQDRGEETEQGELLADISNAIVRIHKREFGKGPVKARAHLSQDLLVVVLEGGFTRGEQTLQESGHEQELLSARRAMQYSIEDEFRAAIESLLYRSVRSLMTANDPSNDLQAEIFVLEATGSEVLEDEETGSLSHVVVDGSPADGSSP